MKLDKTVTIGNVVSWTMIVIGFAAGCATVKGTANLALANSNEAKITAMTASQKVSEIHEDIAVIKQNSIYTKEQIDEIKSTLKEMKNQK